MRAADRRSVREVAASWFADFWREDVSGVEADEFGDVGFESSAADALAAQDECQVLVTHAHAARDGAYREVLEHEGRAKRGAELQRRERPGSEQRPQIGVLGRCRHVVSSAPGILHIVCTTVNSAPPEILPPAWRDTGRYAGGSPTCWSGVS